MARIVGTIHPDRAPERLSDAHRTELEHQPSATLPPTNRGRPPIPPVVFKGSGYDTPENLMEWWEE
jgi:hypothetical protein